MFSNYWVHVSLDDYYCLSLGVTISSVFKCLQHPLAAGRQGRLTGSRFVSYRRDAFLHLGYFAPRGGLRIRIGILITQLKCGQLSFYGTKFGLT